MRVAYRSIWPLSRKCWRESPCRYRTSKRGSSLKKSFIYQDGIRKLQKKKERVESCVPKRLLDIWKVLRGVALSLKNLKVVIFCKEFLCLQKRQSQEKQYYLNFSTYMSTIKANMYSLTFKLNKWLIKLYCWIKKCSKNWIQTLNYSVFKYKMVESTFRDDLSNRTLRGRRLPQQKMDYWTYVKQIISVLAETKKTIIKHRSRRSLL